MRGPRDKNPALRRLFFSVGVAIAAFCAYAFADQPSNVFARSNDPYDCPFFMPFYLAAQKDAPVETPKSRTVSGRSAENSSASAAEDVSVTQRLNALEEKIDRLDRRLTDLQETLNTLFNRVLSDLETENAALRAQLRGESAAGSPTPNTTENTGAPPEPFSFEVIEEWGRTPEEAQAMGAGVTSLKGIVGVVPRSSTREDLENLGRELRNRYADYDNIHIEVFNDPVAAKGYAQHNVLNPQYRVLSITKFKGTERDTIELHLGGETITLAP
jgi:hypothetical protein